jgi:hypothetical protein
LASTDKLCCILNVRSTAEFLRLLCRHVRNSRVTADVTLGWRAQGEQYCGTGRRSIRGASIAKRKPP